MKVSFVTLVATLLAATLVACGGGGGGGGGTTTTPPVTPPTSTDSTKPVLTPNALSPFPKAGTFTITSNEPINGSGIVIVVKKDGVDVVPGLSSFSLDGKSQTWRGVVSLVEGATYTVTASASDFSGNVGTTSLILVVESSAPLAWWPPTATIPMSTKGFTANQIPAAAQTIGDAAWQAAVKDGTIKFFESDQVLTGYSSRKITWAFYSVDGKNNCSIPVYRDDGSAVLFDKTVRNGCNTATVDWAIVPKDSDGGIIRHFPGLGSCFKRSWDTTNSIFFKDVEVPCP